jgi:RNA polymerase sigma-70 factor, ECF subfamily
MQLRYGKKPAAVLSDEEVLAYVRAGDNSHYGLLISRYHTRLYCMALRILKNEADAEDALQEAYIMGLTHLDQFAGRSSYFTWMARITMNAALTRLRSRRRWQRLEAAVEAQVGGETDRLHAAVATPEQLATHEEADSVLEHSVRMLPESYRAVFEMREIQEFSTADVARSLGVTEECVKTRLHRARELLQRKLGRRLWPRRAEWLAA